MIEAGQQYKTDTGEILTITNISVYWSVLYQSLSGIVIYERVGGTNSEEKTAKNFTLLVMRRELIRVK